MSGLEKILEQIRAEAEENARKITDEAEKQAAVMEAAAREEAEKQCAAIAAQAAEEAAAVKMRADAARRQEAKKRALAAKQQVIGEVIAEARASVAQLPEEDYFALIERVVSRYALPQAGEIAFSAVDLKRLPRGFEKRLQHLLKERGGSLSIAAEPVAVSGGFVLRYGGVEENCSIDSLFDSHHEELQDLVHALLFSE